MDIALSQHPRHRSERASPRLLAWKRLRRLFGLVVTLGLLASSSNVSLAEPAGLQDPDNWPQYHRTHDAWRFSPLSQINNSNVRKLHVAWIHQPGDITHGVQATPLVIDGIVYYVSAFNTVLAVDGATGKQLWKYKPKLD